MEKYADGVLKLMHQMLEIFSTLLGLQPKYLEERFGNPVINTRTNFYPPCPQPDLVLGLAAHSDSNSMTVLFQDDTGGLQVKKGNCWVGVAPVTNVLVINVGDQIQVQYTTDTPKSTTCNQLNHQFCSLKENFTCKLMIDQNTRSRVQSN
jgi:isopenicillin N synthase-like dioxygenase